MELRFPVTAKPVLAGPPPGVTFTVNRVGLPAATDDGFAAPVPVGAVLAEVTVSETLALPLRPCASAIVAEMVLDPAVVVDEMGAL
jgi:hypothetical protein